MKACANYRESLALLASESLDPCEAIELRQHIAQCPHCRDYFRELSLVCETHKVAAGRLPTAEVESCLYTRVAVAIRDPSREERNVRPRFSFPRWLQASVAVAVLLLLAGGLAFLFRSSPPQQLADSPIAKPSLKVTSESASSNLNTYRIALNRSTDELDMMIDREAARSGFNSNGSLRLGLARLDSEF